MPHLLDRLRGHGAVVLVAPPGTGKTTRVPPALVGAGLPGGRICLVQEPRRIAARACAARVALEQGWQLGCEVGYETRFDRKVGRETRLVFLTEGLLLARLQADPLLEGVGAVVLDEFHERTVDSDLSLAFLRELRATVRPELRLVVMSATLSAGPLASFLDADTVEVAARAHPVELDYLDRAPDTPLHRTAAAGVRLLWEKRPGGEGSLLAFLPGAADIRRTAEELAPWARERNVRLVPLHGDLPAAAQDAALTRCPPHEPRVLLATNVAETSLTVPGLSAVVDSGLAKVLRHDPQSGLDRLDVVAISRSSAHQRAGRAGREGPGRALRLWTQHEERSRADHAPPEVVRVDLCRPLLEILAWGAAPGTFGWFEAPRDDQLATASDTLLRLGATDRSGKLTRLGEDLRRFPLHPRLGAIVLAAARRGVLREGAALAALLSERDLSLSARPFGERKGFDSSPSDLVDRLDLLAEAEGAGFDPGRLSVSGIDAGAARSVARTRDQVVRLARRHAPPNAPPRAQEERDDEVLRAVLAGFPDRVARRREAGSDRFVLVGGAGARLAADSAVRRAEFVVAARVDAGRRGERSEARLRWVSSIESEWLADLSPLELRVETRFDPQRERVAAVEKLYYLDLVLRERAVPPPACEAAALLAEAALRDPAVALGLDGEAANLLARWGFLARSPLQPALPPWGKDDWEAVLEGLSRGRTSFEELRAADVAGAVKARLGPERLRTLERHAPQRVEVPSGSRVALEYPDHGPPQLAVKIQEVFGWRRGPSVAGGTVPVVLHLLAPNGRPLQVTADLESFWSRTYEDVRKEMRGRYPRHRWPEDPWTAPPTQRTTARPPRPRT